MKKNARKILLTLLALFLGGYISLHYLQAKQPKSSDLLTVYGTIDIRGAALAFIEQEYLAETLVEEGQQVTAGQPLARQKTDRIEAMITELNAKIAAQQAIRNRLEAGNRPQETARARAEVEAARARVNHARKKLGRLEKISGSGASIQDVDDARAKLQVERAQLKVREKTLNLMLEGSRKEDIAAARYQLTALQANLSQLKIRLANMTLLAPSSGVIESRVLEVGELAGPTKPVYTMALTDPKRVRAYIPEPMLGRIQPGMKAQVFNDSFPEQPTEGWIGFISSTAEFTPRAVATEELRTKLVYEIRIIVPDKDNRLRLGMPVTVTLNEQKKHDDHHSGENKPPDGGK